MTVSPLRVIRFYGNLDYALECIRLKEITFLHPDKLNDPFDPAMYFVTEFKKDYQSLIEYVQKYHPKDLQRFNILLPKDSWEMFLSGIEKYLSDSRNNAFIFSTCGIDNEKHPKDSLYMWSHYGNGHRGVAIEFDTSLLSRPVSQSVGTHAAQPLYEISYGSELPKVKCESIYKYVINGDKTDLSNIFQRTFGLKSAVWKKEKVWRFMLKNEETELKVLKIGLEDDTITAIYLGCRIDARVKDDLIFETKNKFPNAKIYKSKIVRGNFALEFEPLF